MSESFTTNDGGVEALYAEQFEPLVAIAVDRYAIEPAAAEEIAADVLLSVLLHLDRIEDVKAWLRGAICGASERYVQSRQP